MTDQPIELFDGRFEVVATGYPLVSLLTCTTCGVLLWDVEKHYAYSHPRPEDEELISA